VKRKKMNAPTPIAFGLDGKVYLSVMELDGVASLEEAMATLRTEQSYFIGVALTQTERKRVLPYLRSAGREAAGFIAGGRRWK